MNSTHLREKNYSSFVSNVIFKHDSELGNAPANKLFDLVTVEKNCGEAPPRTFSDYKVTIDKDNCPKGVTIEEKI